MNCSQCQEALGLLHARDTSADEHRALETHLATCPACAAEASRLEVLFTALDHLEQPSPAMGTRFAQSLRQSGAASRPSRSVGWLAAFNRLWPTRPTWALSYSFSVLCMGMLGGQLMPVDLFNHGPAQTEEQSNTALLCPVEYSPFGRSFVTSSLT